MTLRRQWILVLTLTALAAVLVNTLLLGALVNRNFLSYTESNYSSHLAQLEEFAKNALTENTYSSRQLAVQLESHLDDPITGIKLYDAQGHLVAASQSQFEPMNEMMNRMMRTASEEVDSIQIKDGGTIIGVLNITRYSSPGNSVGSQVFRLSLLRNSLFSFGLVFFALLFIGFFISRRMSRDLSEIASMAVDIDLGVDSEIRWSKVKEIQIIQHSLDALRARLKLKQRGRKRLIDEMVHQTRTPLTILQTHLEGLADGLIQMTPEETKVCREQIENISSIVTNMSAMLDADPSAEKITPEHVEINQLLKKIVNGLKVQFDQKHIELSLQSRAKVFLYTDPYKLSQSIYNIVINAYKFTDPAGRVTLSYETSGGALLIRIRDTGTGIRPEDRPHLFDAYYKGKAAQNNPGEGLGLFVAKNNLESLGGSVQVASNPGPGSEFILTLPLEWKGPGPAEQSHA